MRKYMVPLLAIICIAGLVPSASGATVSIWPGSAVPTTVTTGDTDPITLGLKFQSAASGYITGVRFYKGPSNTGTHIGSLWTSAGSSLASVTFSGETASGWQEQLFDTPVAIAADTTYVVSYFSPSGEYSFDAGYFSSSGTTNAPLRALEDGVDGDNAVFEYAAGNTFPDTSGAGGNYWVDVVYVDSLPGGPVIADTPAHRGFVERFDTVEATYSWLEWADEYFYFPWWDPTDDGLFIYSTFQYASFLYATDDSSEGRLTGDFIEAKVAGIEADVYLDWPDEVDRVYLYLYSGTDSNLYSYTPAAAVSTNWQHISVMFTSVWWEKTDGINTVIFGPLPDNVLTNVTEVGVYVEAAGELEYPTIVNVDNFGLIAEKYPPELDIRLLDDPDTTEVRWDGLAGQVYTLQYRDQMPGTDPWTNVSGAVDLVGVGVDLAVTNVEGVALSFYRATTDTNSYTYPYPMGMKVVPAGVSFMGDQWAEGDADEQPQHSVTISTYRMDCREVTNMKMADVLTWALDAGKINATTDTVTNAEGTPHQLVDLDHPDCQISYLPTEEIFEVETDKELNPCVAVTWYGAQAFCNYLSDIEGRERCISFFDFSCDFSKDGYRLPTEAEWEKGARGGLNYHHYPWSSFGNGFASFIDGADANYDGSGDPAEGLGDPETMPVGSYPANAYGVFDMAGNVREWVWDFYLVNAYNQPWVGGPDPTGPVSGTTRVIRSGSWDTGVGPLRCAARDDALPATAAGDLGFRAVLME